MQPIRLNRLTLAVGLAACVGGDTKAVDVPDYGLDWVTIGDPGNPYFDGPWSFFAPLRDVRPVGKVDRIYRMTRTEITVGQWYEFVLAYAPYLEGFVSTDFRSTWIQPGGVGDDGVPDFVLPPEAARFPTTASFLYAAMYCNWLHNDKSPEYWAFRDGAYDMDALEQIAEDGTGSMEFRRRPGALFWISDLDEWMKGMYWDPDRHGPGQGGYWTYPTSSDEPPVGGVDTNAGTGWWDWPRPLEFFNVGSFPHAASPWGLLDGSGGEPEWQDYEAGSWLTNPENTYRRGSSAFGSYDLLDLVDWVRPAMIELLGSGIRLSSVQPCVPDFAVPYGMLDLADVVAFVTAYTTGDPAADVAEPIGMLDTMDVLAFVEMFGLGCG